MRHTHHMTTEVAERLLELIHDLGECQDAREILVAGFRHLRFLFGEFSVAALLVDFDEGARWMLLPMESPYAPSWGGVAHHMVPAGTDIDSLILQLGRDVTGWLENDSALKGVLRQSREPFRVTDDVVAIRLGALTGSACRCFWAAGWKRPSGQFAWMILGFPETHAWPEGSLQTYARTVETTSRMAFYPSLLQSVRKQEEVNHSIRRNIVHDLKTPLTVIKGYAETLLIPGVCDDAEMRDELLQGVVESCDRLLDDIKEIIEPLTGVYVPQRAEMDLATTLQKVVMAERHTERSKSHQLVLMGTDAPAPYHGDRRKLMRVFENLISNAVKYSPGHGKTVTIRLQRGPGEYAVSIHDEGLGMTDVQLARVLNRGGRVVEETLGIEGSGFGLSSCQLVLEAHGGRLDARSEPGKGSIFAAILPDSPEST